MMYNSKIYNFWNDNGPNVELVFTLKRGSARRKYLSSIFLEVPRQLNTQHPPTKLAKFARIRRANFLPLLTDLIAKRWVQKHGTGTPADPFFFAKINGSVYRNRR